MTKVDRTAGAMADINYEQLGCDRWNNVQKLDMARMRQLAQKPNCQTKPGLIQGYPNLQYHSIVCV